MASLNIKVASNVLDKILNIYIDKTAKINWEKNVFP